MKRGFTLIEIIVSVGIFAIVMTVALGALLSMNLANRRAQSVRIVIDNVNFALESMTREMRLGQNYHCGTDVTPSSSTSFAVADCAGEGSSGVAFVSSATTQIQYRLGPIVGSECDSASVCVSENGTQFFPLTSPEITVTALRFVVTGTGSDKKQPQVIIDIAGTADGGKNIQSDFKIQSTITQRVVDANEQ